MSRSIRLGLGCAMPKPPIISAKEVLRLLLKYGCELVSVKGSHFKIHNPTTNRTSVIPVHGNRDISKPFLNAILSQLDIDSDDFFEFH